MKAACRVGRVGWLVLALVLLTGGREAAAQGPTIDQPDRPRRPVGANRLGSSVGSAEISSFNNTPGSQDRPIGGRVGPSVSRAPLGSLNPPRTPTGGDQDTQRFRPEVLEPANLPRYGSLELPPTGTEALPPDGLTLDEAIDRLYRANLDLLALRHEIDQAEADVLTASLRANPVFYADAQLVPYGGYSNANPGGPVQYDVNVTYPIDVTRKRRARTIAAQKAKRVTEAQFQDAVRLEIDNLYTAYVDVVAANETSRYSQAYAEGIGKILELNLQLLKSGQIAQDATDTLRVQVEQAQLQVREAGKAVGRSTRRLALLLNIPRQEAEGLRVRSLLRDVSELPLPESALIERALASRPDLVAYRLGVNRADADVMVAHAERLSDVYLLYQPYTLQNNQPYGLRSPTSWALGLTVPLPVYNRNQGNIARAKSNAMQTRIELTALERQVANEAEEAVKEFELSREGVLEQENEIIPSLKRVRDAAFRRFQGGQANVLEYLEAQRQYNDGVRQYRDALVRHRRAMLDLNTAVGARILP